MPDTLPDEPPHQGSARAADIRFVAPHVVRRVVVLGSPRDAAGFDLAGCAVSTAVADVGTADLVVTSSAMASQAARAKPRVLVVKGLKYGASPTAAGLTAARLLALPGVHGPREVLPLDRPSIAVRTAGAGRRPRDLVRRAALVAATRGPVPDGWAVTLATNGRAVPHMLTCLSEFGLPSDPTWVLWLGSGDDLQRAVFLVADPGSKTPRWAVKFSRVRGNSAPFDADEKGLRLAANSRVGAARAPRLHGRTQVDGLSVSVEDAIVGQSFVHRLVSVPSRARRLAEIDEVADWVTRLAADTVTSPESLRAERTRLAAAVHEQWPQVELEPLDGVVGVLAHNDLGTWNLMSTPCGFRVLDWESARYPFLPMADLLYFLCDALTVEKVPDRGQRVSSMIKLLGGSHRHSQFLFNWIRRYVRALHLPPSAVGSLATLGWVHHATSPALRMSRLALTGDSDATMSATTVGSLERIAHLWMTTPVLGPAWRSWM